MKYVFNAINKNDKPELLPMGGKTLNGDEYSVNTKYLMKNGKPYLPITGEFHYSRWNPTEWKQSLLKMKAGGVEIVATYVFWIHHEEKKGEWDFSDRRNLREFLKVCSDVDMKVWLRIGPWAHGECRNGGFPDWLVKDDTMEVRTNDETYLKYVDLFFQKIGEQASGMMCKDGGPIVGIQIENEYGHCGGPSDREIGLAHMKKLKEMAIEHGMVVPYYTATGWGGAYVLQNETLPVLGGYVDAPWEQNIEEMPENENFLFLKFHNDTSIGSDLGIEKQKAGETEDLTPGYTFNINKNPYLTAEIGAGLQVTAHRRTYPYAIDIEAQTLCMLGAGANLIGYYMYHGGYNPEGKYSTLQESKETGYINDLPIKSYDFQTCIRETGRINDSFNKLKKLHYFMKDMEEFLTPADPFFAEGVEYSAKDLDTPRICIRHNVKNGAGFIFINNHQRKRIMKPFSGLDIIIRTEERLEDKELDSDIIIKNLSAKTDECKIIPYRLPLGDTLLLETNASYLCKAGDTYYFYTDEEPRYLFKDKAANIITLSTAEAENAYLVGEKLIISENLIITEDTVPYEISVDTVEDKVIDINQTTAEDMKVKVIESEILREKESIYDIYLDYSSDDKSINDMFLQIDFNGDKAELYSEDKLLTDWFSNGENWNVALKRFGYPEKLTVKVYPFKENVYYDLPPKKGCSLNQVNLVKERIQKV